MYALTAGDVAGPVAAYGLGQLGTATVEPIAPASPSGSPAMQGAAFFQLPAAGFSRSAELGLLIALVLVVYIDGRVLPRKR